MNLYYAIITSIWLAVLYAIWAATEAGDPGYGQVAFLIGGLVATWYIRKRKLERPRIDDKKIEMAHVDMKHPTLEDVFIELTGRSLRE